MLSALNSLTRNRSAELMDQPDLPEDQHRHALQGLARLNRFTGIARQMFGHLRRLAIENEQQPLRVLDIASGSGDLPIDWAVRAAKQQLPIEITALDISEVAVAQQLRRAKAANVKINAVQADCLTESLPTEHHVVTSSLFMHHLDPPDVITLLAAMHKAATKRVVICDLERSRLNLGLVKIGAHALTRSHVVHTDAALSVHGAYTIDEFTDLIDRAVNVRPPLKRVFPCRFVASWDPRT